MSEESKKEISWRAAEFRYFKKSLTWYLWVIGIAVLLLIFAIWQNNFFFAVFIAIASIIIIFMGKRRPRIVDFKVDEKGIYIDKDTFYPYKELKWFSIRTRPDSLNEIVVKRSATINSIVKIQADSQITPEVRKLLKENLEEKEYEDSIVDSFADLFRF
jgi:hypothetical protein